jgi:hypothetical protein
MDWTAATIIITVIVCLTAIVIVGMIVPTNRGK